ncbi:MAG: glycerophosphodiester phosphodiesterase family protein [Caldilineaceae bacterium]
MTGCVATPAAVAPSTAAPTASDTAGAVTPFPAGFDVEGHRGARRLAPENTLPAFETALDLGVTTLELDLHLSADGELVIWHDDTVPAEKCRLDPMAATPFRPIPTHAATPAEALMIRRLTMDQLRRYICDRNPDPGQFPAQRPVATDLAGANYRMVTLRELFDFVARYGAAAEKTPDQRFQAAQVQFNVETKRKPDNPAAIGDDFDGEHPGEFERTLVALIEEYGLDERVIVQSFDHRSLQAVAQLNPTLPLAALTAGGRAVEAYAALGATIWSPRARDVTPDLLDRAHTAGLRVIPWTVNDPDDMRRLIDLGVDGIITDRPDLLLTLAD